MNPGLPGHNTRATCLTVMGVSFVVIHYFIPNNFDFKNDNALSLFQNCHDLDTFLEISVVYRKQLCIVGMK
jgi:hypothetical protein